MMWYSCRECGWTSGATLTDDEALSVAFEHEDETAHEIVDRQESHPER